DVVESEYLIVLVNLAARNFAPDDFAEDAVIDRRFHSLSRAEEPSPSGFAHRITRSRPLFVHARDAFAAFQLREHVVRSKTMPRQHDQTVEPQVRSFANDLKSITVLCGQQGLRGLLADLLQNRVVAFGEQACHIRTGRTGCLARFYGLTEPAKNVRIFHCFVPYICPGSLRTGSVSTHRPSSSLRKKQRP